MPIFFSSTPAEKPSLAIDDDELIPLYLAFVRHGHETQ